MQPSVSRVVSQILHYCWNINNIGRLGGNELGLPSTDSRLFNKRIGFVSIHDHCVVCSTKLGENLQNRTEICVNIPSMCSTAEENIAADHQKIYCDDMFGNIQIPRRVGTIIENLCIYFIYIHV